MSTGRNEGDNTDQAQNFAVGVGDVERPFPNSLASKSPSPMHHASDGELKSPVSLSLPDQKREGDIDTLPLPVTAEITLQSWNSSRSNVGRVFAAYFSFMVAGLNDSSVGALIPYLERYYGLSYTTVSLIFLTPFGGYSLAAAANVSVHTKFGQRGIAVLAPLCQLLTYVIICFHPPFPVVVVAYMLAGFGTGLLDAAWCAWMGNMRSANAVQGFLHASYSFGALFGPLIATSMITRAKYPWYAYFYFMIAMASISLAALGTMFWHRTGKLYCEENPKDDETDRGRVKEAVQSKLTWLCSAFFFVYIGLEVTLGGWIVSFMLRVRKASNYDAGISATGFWAGNCVGRAGLGFVTDRFGESLCVFVYLIFSIALQLIFWFVPSYLVSTIAVAFVGMFIGPLFPTGVIMATKILPTRIHVSAIGFAAALGGTGGTVFPFAVGAIAQSKGVSVLQPIVLSMLACLLLLWCLFPKVKKRE